jgi:1,2-diacylglycerol 3-alpha-glucosyltransferase
MRILHLCLSNFYVDGFSYQENELVRQNILDGHVVEVIASTETVSKDGSLAYTQAKRYLGSDGAVVERIPYSRWLPHFVMRKLRIHPGVYSKIETFEPDVILFHCACGWEINTAARYVKLHPGTKLFVDSHEDFVNSARGFISKWVLHYLYYRPIMRFNCRYIEKVLPVSVSCLEFDRDFYGIPAEKIELFPLGGHVLDDNEFHPLRNATRKELGIATQDILIVQSGKIDKSKKLVEALKAFSKVPDQRFHFLIAGMINADVDAEIRDLIAADSRIRLLGWQSAEQLRALLCAADVYCQPGTQSATMQMSLACRCVVMLDDVPSHRIYLDGNGWLLGEQHSLESCFRAISQNKESLPSMSTKSHEVALRLIDYRKLAARLYR